MVRDVRKYLEDVLISVSAIESHLDGFYTLSQYDNDLKTKDSVERRLAIIGEAIFKANKLDEVLPISDKAKIIGLRHILVHDYDLLANSIIWLICKNNLPTLKEEVTGILKTLENN